MVAYYSLLISCFRDFSEMMKLIGEKKSDCSGLLAAIFAFTLRSGLTCLVFGWSSWELKVCSSTGIYSQVHC